MSAPHDHQHIVGTYHLAEKSHVEKAIAKAGHDTKDIKATDEQYAKIHGCCKYRTDEVH
jgi:delta 1-pyrroline-5-carboxylate dehydrogenase